MSDKKYPYAPNQLTMGNSALMTETVAPPASINHDWHKIFGQTRSWITLSVKITVITLFNHVHCLI